MNIKDQLINLGWSIKPEFFEGNKQRIDDIKKQLLDSDLRQTGEKSLPEMAKLDQTTKPYIVQLHKTRNVTAPKDNETSSHRSHLYRLSITDGHGFQNALVLPSLRNFNLDTPPGVKILIKPKTKISNGFYILNDQTCEVLGGNVNELVQKWKLNKLMGKHVRTLIGEGAPPPWVPFGIQHTKTVDTSQRSMDVAKMQQTNEEDPEFVRQRRAAIDTLLTDQVSKTQRFAGQDVIKGKNLAKAFEQASQRMPIQRPNTAAAASSTSSVSNKSTNIAAAAAAIKANTRLPEWAKNQIADEPIEDDKRRPQSDRKQLSRRNFDDDDDDRPKRGGGFGRNRRGRGRGGDDDDGGEETRPSKDVTLFDFFGSKPTSTTQKASTSSKTQKLDSKPTQGKSASNQSRISSAVQKQLFEYDNGDKVLARYYEDNGYYPAIVMNIMYDTQKCAVMFEGYDSQEIVGFDDVEPFEEGYYDDEEEEYEQEQLPPPPSSSSQKNNAAAAAAPQYQQPPQQRNQPFYQQDQSGYDYYNQQQQPRDNQNRNRPNSGRNYPQQQYPNRYNNNNNNYHY